MTGGDERCSGKVFNGGGIGRLARAGRAEPKAEDEGCNVGDGFLSRFLMSANGRGGGAKVNGNGKL